MSYISDTLESVFRKNIRTEYVEEVFFQDNDSVYPTFNYSGTNIPTGHGQYYGVSTEAVGQIYFETYKKFPCLVRCDHIKFTQELISFLKQNAKFLYKHNSSFTKNFLFDYKQNFVAITCNLNPEKQSTTVDVHVQHSLDVSCVYNELLSFRQSESKKSKLGILKRNSYGGIEVAQQDFLDDKHFNLEHYNDDFEQFYGKIKEKLSIKRSGLYLLHGEPGTGKTSFIRHLTSQVDREFIFIPPQMVSTLTSPDFTSLLTSEHSGSVLIIEDAEAAMMKRSEETGFQNSEIVSSLLNLTDGLYADITQVSIIATYNCDRNKIDEALLRKGRLKAEYEFKKLDIEKSQKIFDTRKVEHEVTSPMTLADIFSHEDLVSNVERESEKPKRAIGFGK